MTVTVGVAAKKMDKLEATSRESFLLDVIGSSVMCTSHPRTTLSAQVLELEDDGSNYALITNATCLALIDSGIGMRHLFAGVNCAVAEGRKS
jgi:ribonuclease PH